MSEQTDGFEGLDSRALNGVPSFESVSTGKYWQAKSIHHHVGIKLSEAVVLIPLADEDDDAPAVVAVSDSPINGILIGSRAKIEANGITEFAGNVVAIEGDIRSDVAEITIVDDRWILQGMPIIGSFWQDSDGKIVYRQSMRAHCNQDGLPNAIFVDGYPFFCTPRFGLADGDPPADPATNNSKKATYWTPTMVGQHVQWLAQNANTNSGGAAWMPDLPSNITWSENWISEPDTSIAQPRKSREFILDGLNVLDAAQMALTALGPWALCLTYDGYQSTISSCRTKFDPDSGNQMEMIRPLGPADPAMAEPTAVVGGQMRMDGTNYYSVFVATGAAVGIERRASYNGVQVVSPGHGGGGGSNGSGGSGAGDGGGGDGGGGSKGPVGNAGKPWNPGGVGAMD